MADDDGLDDASFIGAEDGFDPPAAHPLSANIAANVVTAMDENFFVLVIVVMTCSLSYLVPYLRKVFGLSLFSCESLFGANCDKGLVFSKIIRFGQTKRTVRHKANRPLIFD